MQLSAFNARQRVAQSLPVNEGLTEDEVIELKGILMQQERHNVFPNKFNRMKPFRVSVYYDNRWINPGVFSCLETATAVAAIVATACFGQAASTGAFDEAVVNDSKEFSDWMEANAEIVERAVANV